MGETNQDVGKRDEPVRAVEKSRPVQDRMQPLAIRRTQQVSRFVVTADIQGASKPAVHILGPRDVPTAEIGGSVARRVESRRRLEELADAGFLQRIAAEQFPFGVLLRQAAYCQGWQEQEKQQKVLSQPPRPLRKVWGRAVNPARGGVPETAARRRCFEIVRAPGHLLRRRLARKRKYPARRSSCRSNPSLRQCGLPCECRH